MHMGIFGNRFLPRRREGRKEKEKRKMKDASDSGEAGAVSRDGFYAVNHARANLNSLVVS